MRRAGAHTLFERTTRYWSLQYAALTVPLEAPMRALSAAAVHMGAVDLRRGDGGEGADEVIKEDSGVHAQVGGK